MSDTMTDTAAQPLAGIRVLDFGHTVMGPSAGLIMADLGAEVIRVEPAGKGDPTRKLKGFGTGYFPFFNRNKKSLALDLKSPEGKEIAHRLLETADVLVENFGPGAMARLGLSHDDLKDRYPRLIYLTLKGFLPGPYEDRTALDEVIQMMSGLAYMTGPPGQPLRAGSSVIDIMGGMFGVIGVLTALRNRDASGQGELVRASLFESAMFLMGQHLAYAALSDEPVPPMPARVSAWAIYDQFDTADGERVFVGITSDAHWARFCEIFDQPDLLADETLATNNQRIDAKPRLIERLTALFAAMPLAELEDKALSARLPFAHIARPEQLSTDPHLLAGQRLLPTRIAEGITAGLPALPIEIGAYRARRADAPPEAGQDSRALLTSLGYGEAEIDTLIRAGHVVSQEDPT